MSRKESVSALAAMEAAETDSQSMSQVEDHGQDQQKFAHPVNSAWDDVRRSVMASSYADSFEDSSNEADEIGGEGFPAEALEGVATDAKALVGSWALLYMIGRFSLSPVWMIVVVIFCFHIVHMRWKLLLSCTRKRPLMMERRARPAIPDQGIWVNAFLADIWPRHLHILEQRLQESLFKRVAELKATGISGVRLVSLKILRGRPRVSRLRSHAEPPVVGGTSDRARPGDDMDQVLDADVEFDGMVEMQFFVQLLMGSVQVRVRLTYCEATVRLRFYNRLDSQPFYGGFTAEVMPAPEPVFVFNVKVGYLTASRVPFVEDFFLSQMQRLVRKTRVDFRLRRTEAEPEPTPFCPEGILIVSVLGCSPIKSTSASSTPIRAVASDTADDDLVNRRMLHTATAVEIAIGEQAGLCLLGSSSSSGASTAFAVSSWNGAGGPSVSAAAMRVRVLEKERELGRGRAFIDDVMMVRETNCMEWDVVLKPRSLGKLRLLLLWEPLVVQRFIRPDMVRYGLHLWSNARSGLCNMMPLDDDLPTEFCGIVRVQAKRVGMHAGKAADAGESREAGTKPAKAATASAFEWNPFVTVTIGADKLATKPPGKQMGLPALVEFSDVFEFLLSTDSFSTSRIVFRVFDRRWSSSSLLGSAVLNLADLIFRRSCMCETRLDLDNGDVGFLDVCVTFQPTMMLQRLGHRAMFFEQNMAAAGMSANESPPPSQCSSSPSSFAESVELGLYSPVPLTEISPDDAKGQEDVGATEASLRDNPKDWSRMTPEMKTSALRRRRKLTMTQTKHDDDAISSQQCRLM